MEELFNEQEIKKGKTSCQPLVKLPQYTSEQYCDDILDIFYTDRWNRKVNFQKFETVDARSCDENADVKFIKEIAEYNFNIIERFCLIFVAISKLKTREHVRKNDLIETLVEQNIAKPSYIVKLLNDNSKLFTSKCICYKQRGFGEQELEINENLFNLLFNISPKEKKEVKKKVIDINPNYLYKTLNKYIIGQDVAIKNISAAVYEHILKCKINKNSNSKDKLDKTNTLIIGPTGTGKTFICNTLSKILNIPIYIADASQMTETGYVGLSPDSIFTGLFKKCRQIMSENKFPVSIIYVDEIDKIAINKKENKDDVGTKNVQEEFLKIFESTTYFCSGGKFNMDKEYDISNVMFILGGAFSGLEKIIEDRLNLNKEKSIGFFKEEHILQDNLNILQQATTDDLIKYGFMPEFIGRLPNKIILNALTKQDLIRILTESQNNVISQYKQVFMEAGIKLEILEETIEYVAEQAIKNNTGARGLKSILSGILNKILFEASSKGQTDFTLSPKEFSLFSNSI